MQSWQIEESQLIYDEFMIFDGDRPLRGANLDIY